MKTYRTMLMVALLCVAFVMSAQSASAACGYISCGPMYDWCESQAIEDSYTCQNNCWNTFDPGCSDTCQQNMCRTIDGCFESFCWFY